MDCMIHLLKLHADPKDVTGFLDEHPAGRNIILLHGGKDCTKEFLEVHSEDGFFSNRSR